MNDSTAPAVLSATPDCGHDCCDCRSDPHHDHFLSPEHCCVPALQTGVPTGGQFAPSDHPESGVTLEPTLATEATWLTGYAAEQLREILDWDDVVEQSLVATIDGELDEHNTGTLQYVTDLICARLEAEHGVRPVGPHQRPALSIDVRPVGRSDAAIAVEYDHASGVVMSSGRLYWDDDVRPHLSTDHPRFEERMEAIYATINQHAAALLAEIKRIQA